MISLRSNLEIKKRRTGAKSFTPYRVNENISDYARLMREWPQVESREGVFNRGTRFLPRDYPIFRLMCPDDQYPQAHEIAEQLFESKMKGFFELTGIKLDETNPHYWQLKKETVPPYDTGKFPNKWWKLNPLVPSRTLTAHMGKDTYSHIHYDSSQGRVISVREAARLQPFPDGFQFPDSLNSAYTQIGNAVPPTSCICSRKLYKRSD
jgi:DNA (cytosine-5)-methyltransferase 1